MWDTSGDQPNMVTLLVTLFQTWATVVTEYWDKRQFLLPKTECWCCRLRAARFIYIYVCVIIYVCTAYIVWYVDVCKNYTMQLTKNGFISLSMSDTRAESCDNVLRLECDSQKYAAFHSYQTSDMSTVVSIHHLKHFLSHVFTTTEHPWKGNLINSNTTNATRLRV